jgi:hypothetical protein
MVAVAVAAAAAWRIVGSTFPRFPTPSLALAALALARSHDHLTAVIRRVTHNNLDVHLLFDIGP